ncbi:hypothetical protein SNE40_004033 [Patella caerulea]|uniref:CARD domain-containing protein n=1 Tax=Patella caerulea TaxID=87958 RepID=A0AAN8Q1G7_PATCE
MEHYSLWTEEHGYLVEQFTNKQESIIGALFQHFIIDDNDKEQIRKEKKQNCNEDGARKLVEILGYRGKDSMPRIIEALATIKRPYQNIYNAG